MSTKDANFHDAGSAPKSMGFNWFSVSPSQTALWLASRTTNIPHSRYHFPHMPFNSWLVNGIHSQSSCETILVSFCINLCFLRSRMVLLWCFRVSTSFSLLCLILLTDNYRLWLCSRLFEESPAWFCSHVLAMIQACTYHSAIIAKPQQWPTPSESIANYCVRKLVSCVTHLQSCAKDDIWNKKKKLRTVAKSKLKITKIEDYKNWAQLQLLH